MNKYKVAMLCAGMLATGFVLGTSCNMDLREPHDIQYVVDRIEEDKWLVVEVYDKTADVTMMVDIKTEEGYTAKTEDWVPSFDPMEMY